MAAAAMSSFLESVELAEGFTESVAATSISSSSSSRSASIHSPRISFSNDFAQLSEDQGKPQQQIPSGHNPSSSGEFEFSMNPPAAAQAPVRNPPMLSADELFYKGKLLPLHLPPRIRMVQDLSDVLSRDRDPGKNPTPREPGVIGKSPPLGAMRRERSLRSPAKPSVIASTLKSSSYPPPGYSSRPSSPPKSSKCTSGGSSNSRWRELFGLKKSISSPKAGASSSSSSSSVPTKILKMIFNRGGSSSSASSSNPNSSELPEVPQPEVIPSSNEALLPLLRDSSTLSDQHEMTHSSSVSSSASSNWTASSASSSNASSSSFSAEFQENPEQPGRKSESKPGNPRARAPIGSAPSRTRRSGAAQGPRYQKSSPSPAASQQPGKPSSGSGNLQRSGSGSNRRSLAGSGAGGGSSGTRMQLQDHVLIGHGNNKIRTENSWRRSGDHKPIGGSGGSAGASNPSNYSSSVRVTPVLHVPACIGPSLRNVRVQGLKRLFSSSSSGSNAPGKPQTVI